MNVLTIVTIGFLILEATNVVALNYSAVLGWMIAAFIVVFLAAVFGQLI
jgi:hypothetical protein